MKLIPFLLLLCGCATHPIPFTDTGHGTYLCPNYWCQRFETDNCENIAALTWIAHFSPGRDQDATIASNRLRDHWNLMLDLNRQQMRQAMEKKP